MPFELYDRVRMVNEVNLFAVGVFPAGTTATVIGLHNDGRFLPIATLRLDSHWPNLDEWQNELHVYGDDDEEGGVYWDDFVKIDEISPFKLGVIPGHWISLTNFTLLAKPLLELLRIVDERKIAHDDLSAVSAVWSELHPRSTRT